MVNTEMFDEAVRAAGYTLTTFAKEVGISRAALWQKRKNEREFGCGEIKRICKCLGLDRDARDQIFFAEEVA